MLKKLLYNRHNSRHIAAIFMLMTTLAVIFTLSVKYDSVTVLADSTDNTTSANQNNTSGKPYGTVYTNDKTGYKVILEDDANLLDADEAAQLIEDMKPITAYGGVAFKSTNENKYGDTSSLASSYYASKFNHDSGTVLVIDMKKRNIWIHSNGRIYSTVTKSYANVITDNVYRYASAANYYTCASKVYEQELAILMGGRISQPMKYISNALLALAAAILINYFIVRMVSRKHKASQNELVSGIFVNNAFNNPQVTFVRQTKTYDPPSSDSSSGGSSSSGGGGGGSSSSGGGGGHSF